MAGAFPNLDMSDYETRVRTYLNEVTANFYTQAEIWQWLGIAAKDISQKTLCVRRILTNSTTSLTRNIVTNAYKVLNVEYIPSSGRPIMLPMVDPLRTGHWPIKDTVPQYWYEHGSAIGIVPVPDAIYNLRIYIADLAKLIIEPVWTTDWTAGARWVLGDTAIHSGASSDLTYTAGITNGANYTFEFNVTGVSSTATLKLTAGTVEGTTITTNGWHCQSLIANGTTFKLTAVNDVTINDFTIYKEADISATTDRYELAPEWNQSLALYATYYGLIKDRQYGPAALLNSLYSNEFSYLQQNIVEVIPDGQDTMKYK
jgi:hypothetical protein